MKTSVSIDMQHDNEQDVDAHYSKGFYNAVRSAWLAAKDANVERVFIVVNENVARVY